MCWWRPVLDGECHAVSQWIVTFDHFQHWNMFYTEPDLIISQDNDTEGLWLNPGTGKQTWVEHRKENLCTAKLVWSVKVARQSGYKVAINILYPFHTNLCLSLLCYRKKITAFHFTLIKSKVFNSQNSLTSIHCLPTKQWDLKLRYKL